MTWDCVCCRLGSSSESFVPLNFVSWELHTLINRKSIGSVLGLHFMLGNTIIKFIYFLRALVLSSWSIRMIFSLWMCGSNTVGVFRVWIDSEGYGTRGHQYGLLLLHCLSILVSRLLSVFKAFLPIPSWRPFFLFFSFFFLELSLDGRFLFVPGHGYFGVDFLAFMALLMQFIACCFWILIKYFCCACSHLHPTLCSKSRVKGWREGWWVLVCSRTNSWDEDHLILLVGFWVDF